MIETPKKVILVIVSLLVLSVLFFNEIVMSTVAVTETKLPQYHVTDGVVEISAKAFGIYDLESGMPLLTHNEYQELPIASVTKLIAASVLVDKYNLNDKVAITNEDIETEGRAGSLSAGEEYSFRELLFPLLLESSNDAAATYERATEGLVVQEMNHLATKLNLSQTNFSDASGLAASNVSSVSELSRLVRHVYQETPFVLDIARLRNFVGPYTTWTNNSPVLNEQYLGGKHGYTEAAGRTIVAAFDEDINDYQRRLVYIVLGSDNLLSDIDKLRHFVSKSVTYK